MMNTQCRCLETKQGCLVLDNYRSILDRRQQTISSWSLSDRNGRLHLTRGTQCRRGNDALLVRSNERCLINPWYAYIDITADFLSALTPNPSSALFEAVLLECSSPPRFRLAIIGCPCLERWNSYCVYCRWARTLVTEPDLSTSNHRTQQTKVWKKTILLS